MTTANATTPAAHPPRRPFPPSTAPLEARQLTKRFGSAVALDGFDLVVSAGEIVGLVGHNGAGKTTFARCVAGLVARDSGSVHVAGLDLARQPRRARRRLGLAPQELALYPTATVRENLVVFAGLYGIGRRAARQRGEALTEALALGGLLDRRVRDLSGGQQRRVQAATAMVHHPLVAQALRAVDLRPPSLDDLYRQLVCA